MRRYTMYTNYGRYVDSEEDDNGEWVSWAEANAIRAKLAKVERERDALGKESGYWREQYETIADEFGYVNRADGAGGCEVAPPEKIIAFLRSAMKDSDEAADLRTKLAKMLKVLREALECLLYCSVDVPPNRFVMACMAWNDIVDRIGTLLKEAGGE